MNTLKTFGLLAALTVFFIWIGWMLGGAEGMTLAFLIAAGMNFFAYWYSDTMVLRMYGAREANAAQAPELHAIVRELSSKAGLPMPKVYLIDDPQPNAFATGRNPEHAAVAVTTGIMGILDRHELAGVIGHELSHIQNRDILIGTVAATLAGAVAYLAQMAQWAMIFGGGRRGDDRGHPIVALVMMIVAPLAAVIIQMAISRSREYAADRGGATISGDPRHLARALQKLEAAAKRMPMRDASPATSHLFIVNPLSGSAVTALFRSHPPTEERVARLLGSR